MKPLLPVFLLCSAVSAQNTRIPIHFEPSGDGFITRTGQLTVHVSKTGAEFQLANADPVRMTLTGSRETRPAGTDRLPGVTNYYIGADRAQWRERVPNYARVRLPEVYPGIDLVYYSKDGRVEYDFLVSPGADAGRIEISFSGAKSIEVSEQGDAVLATAAGEIVHHRPKVYQGAKEVEARYQRTDGGSLKLALGGYDPAQPMVVDPVVTWSTYFTLPNTPGQSQETKGIMIDAAGNVILAGHSGLPDSNLFISKLNAAGTAHLFTTYVGGTGHDYAETATTDAAGNIIVVGHTWSTDFPVTTGAFTSAGGQADVAVAKFTAAGTIHFSTRFGSGGIDYGYGVATTAANEVVVVGDTNASFGTGFPLLNGLSIPPRSVDGFVTKLTLNGAAVFSTLLGGSGTDLAWGVAVDATGIYVGGAANSTDFPLRNPIFVFQGSFNNNPFLTKLNPDGNAVLYSTYLGQGPTGGQVTAVRVNAAGEAHFVGYGNVPVTAGSFGQASSGIFAAKLNAAGSAFLYSGRFLPLPENTCCPSWTIRGMALDAAGAVTLTGSTNYPDFPTVNAIQYQFNGGESDAFAAQISPSGATLNYLTYLGGAGKDIAGGVAVDALGNTYIGGTTGSANFPVTAGVVQSALGTAPNLFAMKVGPGQTPVVSVTFDTAPASGGTLILDGVSYKAPRTVRWTPGSTHTIEAGAQLFVPGASVAYLWSAWSPLGNGQRVQTVTAPAADSAFTASYVAQAGCTYSVSPASILLVSADFAFVNVTTQPNCFWTARSNSDWLADPGLWYSGSGGAALRFKYIGNPDSGSANVAFREIPVRRVGYAVVTAPSRDQILFDPRVRIEWQPVPHAEGYRIEVRRRQSTQVLFAGRLAGNASTSILVTLPNGQYSAAVSGCAGPDLADCALPGRVNFELMALGGATAPAITFPLSGAVVTESTPALRWTAVNGTLYYEVELDSNAGVPELRVSSTTTETYFTLHSGSYRMRVRSCQLLCGPWSTTVTFTVSIPPTPTAAPANVSCLTIATNQLTCSWNPVTGADLYIVQGVQDGVGPGGGALTVASFRGPATSVTNLPVPMHPAGQPLRVLVAACNGNGCGPNSIDATANSTRQIVPGPNPSSPYIATPIPGTIVAGPVVLLSWNRINGDNGSNTTYRLFAVDFARFTTALDVYTKQNFWGAYFRPEGARYDALVFAAPPNGNPGNAAPFNVAGSAPVAPTMAMPRHQDTGVTDTIPPGNTLVGWTPVPGATLYEYYVGVPGAPAPVARGVTVGLSVQVPLQPGLYDAIVRACPAPSSCSEGETPGWGPWSNLAGPGVTKFRVQ